MTGDALDRLHRKMLAETMRCCPELPRSEREERRKKERQEQSEVEDRRAAVGFPPSVHRDEPESTELSTGCAENGDRKTDGKSSECA